MITIVHLNESFTVEAYVLGKFAVSAADRVALSQVRPSALYIVSHIATGRTVAEIKGRDNAKRLARLLDRLLVEDFTADDIVGEPSARYQAFCAAAKPLILDTRNQ